MSMETPAPREPHEGHEPSARPEPRPLAADPSAWSLPPAPSGVSSPQLTTRAVLTGMALGSLLSVCNIYAGLKIGLVFNMSIVTAVIGTTVWGTLSWVSARRVRPWGLLENNIAQTAGSAAASVASAGLIAAIPTWMLVTGRRLPWLSLSLWVFSVCLVGICAAVALRRQLIVGERLAFPSGVATAATLRQMHSRARGAAASVLTLLAAAGVAVVLEVYKYVQSLGVIAGPAIGALGIPGTVQGYTLRSLGFSLAPSPLMVAVGGLIGLRAAASLLIGAAVAFGVIMPALLQRQVIEQPTFSVAVKWLVWPGVTLMVVSALMSLAFSWRSAAAAWRGMVFRSPPAGDADSGEVRRASFLPALLTVLLLSVVLQGVLFKIVWWAAVLGVLLSFGLALVVGRVSGETGINPVAAVAKVTQVSLGALLPHSPATNLMTSNVTAGAASQCADLLDDLKCGHLLGAAPRGQAIAQVCGAAAGALAGTAACLLLLRDPAAQLLTAELPAPAVAGMKAVADLFAQGRSALPPGAGWAMAAAAAAALLLALLEKLGPPGWRRWVPSGAGLGLAFVFPASVSLTVFVGALAAGLGRWLWPSGSGRRLLPLCAGLIVGETLTGFGTVLHRLAPWRPLAP